MPATPSRQQGFGIIQFMLWAMALGFCAVGAFKVGKPYAEGSIVRSVVVQALADAKNKPGISEAEIAKMIFDRANVDSIPIKFGDIEVAATSDAAFDVHVDLHSKIPLWRGASLVLDNSVDESTK